MALTEPRTPKPVFDFEIKVWSLLAMLASAGVIWGAMTTRLDSTSIKVDGVATDMALVKKDVGDTRVEIATVKGDVKAVDRRIDELAGRVRDLERK